MYIYTITVYGHVSRTNTKSTPFGCIVHAIDAMKEAVAVWRQQHPHVKAGAKRHKTLVMPALEEREDDNARRFHVILLGGSC